MNAVTNGAQTALHLATHQGHLRIIERLVGFGVDMNMIDADEDTALHMAVLKDSADALSTDTPQLKKVGLKCVLMCMCVCVHVVTVCGCGV